MYGQVIGTSIAVDCFDEVTNNGIYFLTEGYLQNDLPTHVDRVYTSPHNAWLLRSQFQVDPDKIVSLPVNEKLLIEDKIKELNFYVTLVDAKQKPGAVMFLFEGDCIGNVLYAGRCCYNDSLFSRPLCKFLKSKMVDYLYVHDTCEDCHLYSMTTTDAVQEVVNIVRGNPSCKILIYEPCFREDLLTNLKEQLREPICVSTNIMNHLESVGRGSDFVLDKNATQVFVTDKPDDKKYSDRKIILIPCNMKRSSKEIQLKLKKLEQKRYHVIFYRNHCSPPELAALVQIINAKHTVLVQPSFQETHISNKKKDLNYWSHIRDFPSFVQHFVDLQSETQQLEPNMETLNKDVGNKEVPIDVKTEEDQVMDTEPSIDLTAPSPNSLILIESDSVSIASQETVYNTPAVLC